ncbi:type ISP restriction/modification enzyme [Arthrobacter sp. zg-Y1110]|uniref:DEAD/DEAH box helicase n=1 Tax=Arthrobacter sp. zg-Y1110 TaxID=2886932 RepID=UPI001D1494C0|nr:type ISP restriction/modification enzyme [Arthrobacter sp. zg-Y1110]MCC3291257.1 DEAD/DEAH box helicase family protein [Arthrobacter sp. zg-Y1110]UWX83683.1 DEAD/DEAH box helicase family protein [Arthrobacter sp. zg-Y1110]
MVSSSFGQVLDQLYFSATDERDKGSKFERLIKRYLELEPKYADQFSDVWMWNEWPDRGKQVDTGIDLVARDRYTGELTAIQCKFYDPQRRLEKKQIDSFFTAMGKVDFSYGMVVSTTDDWSKHAEEALEGQSKPTTRLRLQDLAESTIDWEQFNLAQPEQMVRSDRKVPRKYQREAINDVITGFQDSDRGKLIMACGTGKTYTSLKIAEGMVPAGGTALFLVPSIALLQQTLNEWTAQTTVKLRPLAVCSDAKVGRRDDEDVSVHDLAFPATTDAQKLFHRASISTGQEAVTVVFSTYQSIDVIAQAQAMGMPDFDLVLCDEAHRTTGITEPEHDDSAFVRVHDQGYLRAGKRLYMTATPRIYVQDSKVKAAENDVAVYSMDDMAVYGPEFHHLGFGKAVEMGHLADYKVLVLAVNEDAVSRSFQGLFEENGDLSLDDAARIVGCWNGLSKRGVNGERLSIGDTAPMNRAVAFARNIKESKKLAEQFELIGRQLRVEDDEALKLEAGHVDGTFNVLERSAKLDWLQDETKGNVCRILSNAKCLTEGVDVPSLDAVLFLNPRNSQVDVVQAVGRVMRKSEGKEYGYIILPIAVPSTSDPEAALNDNKKYKVVWDVLQALRAHDDRFEAMINKLDLNGNSNDKIDVITVDDPFNNDDSEPGKNEKPGAQVTEALFHMANADEWRNAIFARMVRKVGDRRYWEQWAEDVKGIADRHIIRIRSILDGPDARVRDEFAVFLDGLRGNLNASITENDAIDMLSQHLITKPVFEALFEDYSFAAHNPVSQVMDSMVQVLEQYNLDSEVQNLEEFYRSVRIRAEGVETAEGKQKIITELYERFFKLAFPRTAESLGIVYTPVEVVDFILRAVNDVLAEEFGVTISDEGVHVLDPFTGTGTFIVRLLQSGLIKPEDLLRKYTHELHANELLLMAYYIAAINIEATVHGLLRDQAVAAGTDPDAVGYEPFDGIVLTDTFQMTEDGDTLDEHVFTNNSDRVVKQNALDIRVIIGNPPYSVGQSSGNDNNANLKYPTLDESIRRTYVERSTATNKNSLYDSYIRAIRWASNRILNSDNGGVICYVSNGGYIDGNTADGLRKTLTDEFHEIYVYNLRGNARSAGELRRKEKDNVFGEGSKTTVAVMLLVKHPGPVTECRLNYRDIGDYLDRKQKLAIVDESTLGNLPWQQLTPNTDGDWVNQRNDLFETFTPLGAKDSAKPSMFRTYSGGLKTNRDAWVYNSSADRLRINVESMVQYYNEQLSSLRDGGEASNDPTKISWGGGLRNLAKAGKAVQKQAGAMRKSSYRPFNAQHVHFQTELNERQYQLRKIFPTPETRNFGFYITSPATHYPTFESLMVNNVPDLHLLDTGQFFPRYIYTLQESEDDLFGGFNSSSDPIKIDNIADETLADYQAVYGLSVTKDDIFYYVYGLLHSNQYRERFGADLKKMLPRIPKVPGEDRFLGFAAAGRQLSDLHLGYEDVAPYPLVERETGSGPEVDEYAKYAVKKMKYGGKAGSWDKTRIIYNARIALEGIPADAHRYMLGSRSAVDWILERYQAKTDKASGIVNDPNDWSREHQQPRYIIDLIGRIVTVSIETNRIVDALPSLGVDEQEKPL